jgi:hypothetical protein
MRAARTTYCFLVLDPDLRQDRRPETGDRRPETGDRRHAADTYFDKKSVADAVVAERGTLYAHLHCAACKMGCINVLYLERASCCSDHRPSPR